MTTSGCLGVVGAGLVTLVFAAGSSWLEARQAPSPQAAASVGTGSIVGQVVEAESRQPVRGAIVSASFLGPTGNPSPTLTDDQGRFVFLDLRAGRFILSAQKGGYTESYYGQQRLEVRSVPVVVADGQHVTGLTIKVWKYAAITGTVLDEAGEPVVDVRVQAQPRDYVGGRSLILAATNISRTDDRGVYRLSRVRPGEYVVGVVPSQISMAEGSGAASATTAIGRQASMGSEYYVSGRQDFGAATAGDGSALRMGSSILWFGGLTPPAPVADRTSMYGPAFHPEAAGPSSARVLAVRSGSTLTNIDIRLRPLPSQHVSGRLAGGDGSLGLIAIRLWSATVDRQLAPIPAAVAFSDAEGSFAFPSVPRGSYTLEVLDLPNDRTASAIVNITTEPDIRTASITVDPWSDRPTWWASMPVTVGADDVAELSVSLQRGARIRGRIQFEKQGSAPPPTRIPLSIDRADGRGLAVENVTPLRTNATNEFRTIELPPGRYFITVTGNIEAGWTFAGAQSAGRDISVEPIELGSTNIDDVVVTVSDHANEIKGNVRDARDQPDATASVLLFPADERAWLDFGRYPRRLVDTRVGTDGTFTIRGVPSGDYFIVAVPDERITSWRNSGFLQPLARVSQRLRIADGEHAVQDLRTVPIR